MAGVRVIVFYPRPTDVETFEKKYKEHLSLAARKIPRMTKFVAGKVLGTPSGETAPFHRVAELYFPSMEILRNSLNSPGTQEAVADAVALSSGGAPIFLIAEEEQTVPL